MKDLTTRDLGIHGIEVEFKDNMINIEIHLDRPGLLIGKHGMTIKSLEEYLIKTYSKAINFKIIESNIWK